MVESPTENNRSIFHLTTIMFPHYNCPEDNTGGWSFCALGYKMNSNGDPNYSGQNILGSSMWIDIERVYDMTKIKSDNINGHMQIDKIMVDFGFMTNAGNIHNTSLICSRIQ